MKHHVLMALAYTLFLGLLTLGLCVLSHGDLHHLGEKIDHAGATFVSIKQQNVPKP